MNKETVQTALKRIIWDYYVNPEELFDVLVGKRKTAGPFDAERLFLRMLERLPWYELIDVLGIEYIDNHLNENIIKKIRFKTLRGRYETARKVLSGDTLSVSGWDPEYREKIKHTFLSDRRYRT